MQLSTHDRLESQRRARAASECWVFTRGGELREMTLASAQATLVVDGHLLRRWCLLDQRVLGCAIAIVYSADAPSRELRDTVTQLARARFATRPWFQKFVGELDRETRQPS